MNLPEDPGAIARRCAELDRARQPYVRATVVRTEPPTSARAGEQAVVLADGRMEGFVGGQCTVTSVAVAAVGTLRDRAPVLLRVLPDGGAGWPEVPGASVVVNPCLSGGAVEIFLEPVLPATLVRVAGDSPIAEAVADLCARLGYDVARGEGDGDVAAPDALVIARHGGPEASEIRAALDAGTSYVGLVASPRRAEAVIAEARVGDAERGRVFSPAGHWIGAETPGEIAVSILAELIEVLRLRAPAAAAPAAADTAAGPPAAEPELLTIGRGPAPDTPTPAVAVDPVCGMSVVAGPDAIRLEVDGEAFYFCCAGCRDAFAAQRGVEVTG
ncbi:XdhC family protein [Nocardioides sp. YIM 152588]|uniref:XdhC family protein n=1 Tax=Nocardioides sp. YIM 152588 TaxID=3158259 RepID=UPI0032E43DA9